MNLVVSFRSSRHEFTVDVLPFFLCHSLATQPELQAEDTLISNPLVAVLATVSSRM